MIANGLKTKKYGKDLMKSDIEYMRNGVEIELIKEITNFFYPNSYDTPKFYPITDHLNHYSQKALLIVALIDKYQRLDVVENIQTPLTKSGDDGESPS